MIELMRWAGLLLVAVILNGCIGFGGCRIRFPPLAIEQIGVVLPDPDGGPPVECRGLALDQCEIGFGILDEPGPGLDWEVADINRVVVSCVGACTESGGETRLDVVFANGTSELYANGGYGEFEQSCA
jgi:hypothetical protein